MARKYKNILSQAVNKKTSLINLLTAHTYRHVLYTLVKYERPQSGLRKLTLCDFEVAFKFVSTRTLVTRPKTTEHVQKRQVCRTMSGIIILDNLYGYHSVSFHKHTHTHTHTE